MHALIVVAHPISKSLTHSVAEHIAQGIKKSHFSNSYEIADIAAEDFDPRFSAADIAVHLKEIEIPAEIKAEQARINRADALVLVYPVYWWSMPAILKGWIERVFTNGWAYDENSDGKTIKKLQHLPVHLIAIGGSNLRTYARHGYFGAMKTQIEHGIFGYCGAPVLTSELLLSSESENIKNHLETAHQIGEKIFSINK